MRPNPAEQPDPRVVYADIIDLPHHRSDHHPPMSLMDRAAQFSAYKALSGYEEMIGEEARPVDAKIELGEAELDLLNQKLNLLQETLQQGREVSLAITHFIPDPLKAGGRYETVVEAVRRIDPVRGKLILQRTEGYGNTHAEISLDNLLDLRGDPVDSLEDASGP